MSDPKGEPWAGPTGRVDRPFLENAVNGIDVERVHLCGPPPMMDAVKAALLELGIAKARIKTEAFGTINLESAV